MKWCQALLLAAVALAQPASETSVAGTVRDAAGSPVAKATIYLAVISSEQPIDRTMVSYTDAGGRYRISGLVGGEFQLRVVAPGYYPADSRTVTLRAGERAEGVDFVLSKAAAIAGIVTTALQKPVPGANVCQVDRVYAFGTLRHVLAGCSPADAKGEYVLSFIKPGHGILLMARTAAGAHDARSTLPVEIAARPAIPAPVFFPGTESIQAAEVLVLRSGEIREHLDLELRAAPNLCAEGTVQWSDPEALEFTLTEQAPVLGTAAQPPSPGHIPDDRKFRICHLPPGDYRLRIRSRDTPPGAPLLGFLGVANFRLVDKDLTGIAIAPEPALTVPGEVVWEKEAPEQAEPQYLHIAAIPFGRLPDIGEFAPERPPIPGAFRMENLRPSEYTFSFGGVPAGAYIKELTYGGRSILHESFKPAEAAGPAVLRIVLARDGGTLSVRVENAEGKPVPDANIVLAPAGAGSEAAFAAGLAFGHTNSAGAFASGLLAPGKYRALATSGPVDFSAETVGALWRAYAAAQDVEVGPNAAVPVRLRI